MHSRHQVILEIISRKGKASVNELSTLTGVSVVTIRHDLTFLEQLSYIKRIYGAAVLQEQETVGERINLNFNIKQNLAKYALNFIENGDTVFIEGGSTNSLLARELLNYKGELVVITVCTYIASLLKNAKFDVILLGGLLQSKSESVVGSLTRSCIALTHFNKAFLGIDGYDQVHGFTGRDMLRSDVVNSVLKKDATNIVIADSSKFGLVFPYPVINNKIEHVITDTFLNTNIETSLTQQKIQVHKVCE